MKYKSSGGDFTMEMSYNEAQVLRLMSGNNGYITARAVSESGLPRRILTEMTAAGLIEHPERGIYTIPSVFDDEMYYLQCRFTKGIFSHATALFLHGMTDRTPHKYTMTVPRGYHPKDANVTLKYSLPEIYTLGISETLSPCGNTLVVYDKERTLCDIIKARNATDIQIINQAFKEYAVSKYRNIPKLLDYAGKLRVKTKITEILEVLL
jgi:predicted transcriptional regulator of viral defense system